MDLNLGGRSDRGLAHHLPEPSKKTWSSRVRQTVKIITGMFCYRTNTLSNLPTGVAEFQKHTLVDGKAIDERFF